MPLSLVWCGKICNVARHFLRGNYATSVGTIVLFYCVTGSGVTRLNFLKKIITFDMMSVQFDFYMKNYISATF